MASDFDDYAEEAAKALRASGLRVTVDKTNDRLGAKIRNGRLKRIPFIGVIGKSEVEGRGLAIRSRDEDKDLGFIALDDVIARLRVESLPPSRRP